MIIIAKIKVVLFDHTDNIKTFYSFKQSFSFYKEAMQQEWKPRLFCCMFASLFLEKDQIISYKKISDPEKEREYDFVLKDPNRFYFNVGIYTFFWLFLINLIFFILRGKFSIFYMLGIFAAVVFELIPSEHTRVYPWEMPILFFYCLFLFLTATNNYKWLMLVTPIAVGFKESAILFPVIFLFWEKVDFKKRVIYALITLFLAICVKSILSIITSNTKIFFTMYFNKDFSIRIIWDVLSFFTGNFHSFLLINAGLTLPFFLIPTKNKYILGLKFIAFLFIIAILVYSNFDENRVFLELTPLSLYGFDMEFLNKQN